jgi:hypothetical protein
MTKPLEKQATKEQITMTQIRLLNQIIGIQKYGIPENLDNAIKLIMPLLLASQHYLICSNHCRFKTPPSLSDFEPAQANRMPSSKSNWKVLFRMEKQLE